MEHGHLVAAFRAECVAPLQAAVFAGGSIVLEAAAEDALARYEQQPELHVEASLGEMDALWADTADLLLQTTLVADADALTPAFLASIVHPIFQCSRILARLDAAFMTSLPAPRDSAKWLPTLLLACSHFLCNDAPWHTPKAHAQAEALLHAACAHVGWRRGLAPPSCDELVVMHCKRALSVLGTKCRKETWVRAGCPAPYAFRFLVQHLVSPALDHDVVGRTLALALPLLDQTIVSVQRIGVDVLQHVVTEATPTDVRWHSDIVLHMLYETLKIAMSDASFLQATLRCLADTLAVTSVAHEITSYDRFFPTLLRSWDMTSDVTMKRVYVIGLRPWIVAMGAPHSVQIVQYLPSILTVLLACLENKLLTLDALETLRLVVVHAWVRMPQHVDDVVLGLLRCLVFNTIQSHLEVAAGAPQDDVLAEVVRVLRLLQALKKEPLAPLLATIGAACTELTAICDQVQVAMVA
ncbi:hypothetical protein SPRG_05558 [Saprolegnia parasitica CBS 223.65]|uniref:Uncharacterized protein n=1 Tax=Saprolegnia parasitica (strain CBS 223.65) TaxID=695850 RepID=A0A067CK81_SAPPC|nr:hypothetical protein SPRG_05558 [Saprolegnia parasitica CBS 223.65]KDO29605.1 hypothetical protein SPRG_05558 [Saprolegnia parasitica CBS 223.65]|eukprot:XP_012199665.1 hypothetical protein SPRG_05558 [Saprolegnia parasitica CBS 223.65]